MPPRPANRPRPTRPQILLTKDHGPSPRKNSSRSSSETSTPRDPNSIKNPSRALANTDEGKAYLDRLRALAPYERLYYWIRERHSIHMMRYGLKGNGFQAPAWGP